MIARNLAGLTVQEIWDIRPGVYTVQFEDGISIEMTDRKIILSWYYWEMYRKFPTIPIISTTAITNAYTSSTHCQLGSALIWHAYSELSRQSIGRAGQTPNKWLIWQLTEVFLASANEIYNMTCVKLGAYVTSGSLHDIIEILQEPSLVQAKLEYAKNVLEHDGNEQQITIEIQKVYNVINTILFTNKNYLRTNGVKQLCIPGVVNKGQVLQLFGPRGYVSDINGIVFPHQIDVSYSEGLKTLHDSAIESRSASRASIMNTAPLQDAEYHNRRVQLTASIITEVELGECTGYVTVPHLVEPDDYTLLKGKNYMEGGKVIAIWDTIDHLVGTVIEMRSITGCGVHNRQHVCSVCLGWSYNIIPPKTNVGYALTMPLLARISQNIMSTKHFEISGTSKKLNLDASSSKWFTLNPKQPNKVFLTDYAVNKDIIIRIALQYVKYLPQILHTDVDDLPPARITKIPELGISHVAESGELYGALDRLVLTSSSEGIHLSTEALAYLAVNGWVSGKDYIDIPIPKSKNIFQKKPLLLVPRSAENMMTYFNQVESFTNPKKGVSSRVTDYNTRATAIAEFISVLRIKLNKSTGQEFNMVAVEAIIRSLMTIDGNNGNYNLPHPNQDFVFCKINNILKNRSFATMLASQGQNDAIMETHWTEADKELESILDHLLVFS